MRRLLWVGDACVATGFARATHHTLDVLRESWDVVVLGMHHFGDPDHGFPYPIYPTRPGNILGTDRTDLVKRLQPDVIVLQNDVWNIPLYVKAFQRAGITSSIVASLAIDGKNCQSHKLDGLSLAIFWTKFAEEEARAGGYEAPSVVIPLGIDLEIYKLEDFSHAAPLREHARGRFEATEGSNFDIEAFRKGFVVVNVNRNQQRKRLDLLVDYFCTWVDSYNVPDAYLLVQACPTGEQEYDVAQLMNYYGYLDRLVMITPDIRFGVPESDLVWTYRAADVGMTTTQGEGFGLTTFEMMACGIPQIVPDWAALGDLCGDAALKVPCTSVAATQARVNVIGGIADRTKAIEALDLMYRRPDLREELARRGLDLVRQDRFRWRSIGEAWASALDRYVYPPDAVQDAWKDLERPDEVMSAV